MTETYASGDVALLIDQCRVVAHLAQEMAGLHTELAAAYSGSPGAAGDIVSIAGPRCAAIMEALGEMLNGMDAVPDDNEWTDPIFRASQARWPTPLNRIEAPK